MEDPDTDPVEEPTEDEVVEPAVDPENPDESEEPVDDEDVITVDGMEINAVGDLHTVTIDGFDDLRSLMDIAATVDGKEKVLQGGAFTAAEGKTVGLKFKLKSKDLRIKEVKNGTGEDAKSIPVADNECTITVATDDMTIVVTTERRYTIELAEGASGAPGKISLVQWPGKTDKDKTKDIDANADGSENGQEVVKDDNNVIQFTVAGYEKAQSETKLHVFYVEDGDGDKEEIKANDAAEVNGEKDIITYTIPADVIDRAQEKITISLEVETKLGVTGLDGEDITVGYQGPKDKDGKDTWVASDATGAVITAFAGDTFKFKVTAKDTRYTVSKVTATNEDGGDVEVTEAEGVYSLTMEKGVAVTVETALKGDESVALTFGLKTGSDAGSATAKISSITPAGEGVAAETDATKIAKLLGIKLPAGATEVAVNADGVKVPKDVKEVQVTVTPKTGYVVKAIEGGTVVTANSVVKFVADGDGALNGGKAMAVTAETAIPNPTGTVYFKLPAIKAGDENLKEVKVTTVSGKVALKEGATDVYEIKETPTVDFTVEVKEGYKLVIARADENMVKNTVAGEVKNGFVTNTVTLFTKDMKTSDSSATELTALESEALTFKVEVEPKEDKREGFSVGTITWTGAGDSAEEEEYDEETGISYGAALTIPVTSARDCRFTKISYEANGETKEVAAADIKYDEETELYTAEIKIDSVKSNVKVTVETAADYKLLDLAVLDNDNGLATPSKKDEDGIYQVSYKETYLAGVTRGGKSVDSTVKVLDGATDLKLQTFKKVIGGQTYRQIPLSAKLKGKELTVEVYVKENGEDVKVGTHTLQVSNETSKLVIVGNQEDGTIQQLVDSVDTYELDTDCDTDVRVAVTDDTADLIDDVTYDKAARKIVITTNPKSYADIATETKDGDQTKVEYKTATITATAADNGMSDEITFSAKELFNEKTLVPVVEEAKTGETGDTRFVINVSTEGVELPEGGLASGGSLYYEFTVAGQNDADGNFPDDKMEKNPYVAPAERLGDSQNVLVEVSKDEYHRLGMGAKATYQVSAKLVYDYYGRSNIETASSKGEDCPVTTQDPGDIRYEGKLKVKKAKGAPSALYTGQDQPVVIAEVPSWTSGVNYKEMHAFDGTGSLDVYVNDDGKVEVGSVSETERLGKHVITVTAIADQTESHELYASTATITVNVVKGINEITVYTPSISIYKDKKKGTLKLTAAFNENTASSDGKKYVTAPKSKTVTWEIVGTDTEVNEDGHLVTKAAAPAGMQVDAKKPLVSVKNGTVTVDAKYTLSTKDSQNRFRVLVTDADRNNKSTSERICGLSDVITITSTPMDISQIALVHENAEGKYQVVELSDGLKDTKAKTVLASDVDGAYIYALPKDATKKDATFETLAELEKKLPVIDQTNISVVSGNKKVLEVGTAGRWQAGIGYRYKVKDVYAPNKAVAIKVTTQDGSKITHTLNLKMGYKKTAVGDLALCIADEDGDTIFFDPNSKKKDAEGANTTPAKASLEQPGTPVISVSLMTKNKDGKYEGDGDAKFAAYKLTVKNGKIIGQGLGYAYIAMTAGKTELSLTDTSDAAKKEKNKVYKYEVTNTAYKEAKAPKVKVLDAVNADNADTQKVRVEIPGTTSKYARLDMDWASPVTVKYSYDGQSYTANASEWLYGRVVEPEVEIKDGVAVFEFSSYEYYDLKAGSYKVKITTGNKSGSKFTADALPAAAAIKVVKNKAFTFKPATSYTYNMTDGYAPITGKSSLNAKAKEEYVTLKNVYLKNANVKGVSNNFTHYFEVVQDDTTKGWKLQLKKYDKVYNPDPLLKDFFVEETTAENGTKTETTLKDSEGYAKMVSFLMDKKNKDILTAYLFYTATPSVGYYIGQNGVVGAPVSDKTKITVKLVAPTTKDGKVAKPSQKYAGNNAEVGMETGAGKDVATWNISAGGANVVVAHAMINPNKTNKGDLEPNTANSKELAKDGQIVMKVKGDRTKEKKTYSSELLVITNDSPYLEEFDGASWATASTGAKADEGTTTTPAKKTIDELLVEYGIPVKVSVTVKEKPVATPPLKADDGGTTKPDPADVEINSIALTATPDTVAKGGTSTITAVLKDKDGSVISADKLPAGTKISWSVAGEKALTAGTEVTAVSDTSTTATLTVAEKEENSALTVTASVNGKTGTCAVTVSDGETASVTGIEIANKDPLEVKQGDSIELTATLKKNTEEVKDLPAGYTIKWEIGSDASNTTDTKFEPEPGTTALTVTLKAAANETGDSTTHKLTVTVTLMKDGETVGTPATAEVTVKDGSGSDLT